MTNEYEKAAFQKGERVNLTAGRIEKFVFPADLPTTKTQIFLWDSDCRSLAVRVTRTGIKTFVFQSSLVGQTRRVAIGKTDKWKLPDARVEACRLQRLIDQGEDPREEKKLKEAAIKASRQRDELTVKVAFKEYLEGKRRAKDKFELKQRTKDDYTAMLEAPRPRKTKGKTSSMTMGGMLHEIADKPLAQLTADDIRKVFQKAAKRSERQSGYSMQALRAVMNWHGVRPEQNPFDKSLAGKHRITIAPARPSKKPIEPDRIGEFWIALQSVANEQARDYFAFLLMTGTRVSEPMMIKVADYDRRYGRVVLINTKNRSNHTILLSRQVSEILERRIAGKKAQDHIFDLADGKKTQAKIIAELGEKFRPKDMRSTFASIAAGLVTFHVLKKLLNHADDAADVAGTHYVEASVEQIRAGWQAVADYIEGEGRKAAKSAEVVDMAGARQSRAKGAA